MLTHKRLLIVVLASVSLLALGVVLSRGGAALAMPTAQGIAPTGVTIPYSGRLLDASGQAMPNSAYDFIFSLYDTAEGGTVLWSEAQYGVTVNGGALTTSLGKVTAIPKEVSERKELWLAVSVRGPGEAEFTLLNPRQSFDAGPTAVSALTCPHSHFTDYWGGAATNYGLMVDNAGTGDGIRAYSASTVTNYAAIWAVNNAGTGYGTLYMGRAARVMACTPTVAQAMPYRPRLTQPGPVRFMPMRRMVTACGQSATTAPPSMAQHLQIRARLRLPTLSTWITLLPYLTQPYGSAPTTTP